jgi:cell division septation protein DedD
MTRALTALAAVAALALLPGCGSDKKTIPNDAGASLIRSLRDARDLAGDPDKCPQLQAAVRRVQSRVEALPASVDKDTRDSLVNGVSNLIDDAQSECKNVQTTPTTTTPTTTTPTETQPTETQPTQTQPTAPPPTTPQTTPTQTTPNNGGVTPGNPPEVAPGQGKKGKKDKGGEG